MNKFAIAATTLMLSLAPIHASENSAVDLLKAWTLLEVRCPIGCFETTANQFKPQTGKSINLKATQNKTSPVGACAKGQLHFVLEELPLKDVLTRMNAALPQEAVDNQGKPLQFSLENTGLGFSAYGEQLTVVKTGVLECRDPAWKGKWEQRKFVVSIDAHRMVTLEEDGALGVYYSLPKQ
ncbi:hypothetical protein [Limnobacter sp.]|uniref:hypothetical protein n=1 Tax=Limnobacter sp. TaxID=2003368 RepID=UPI002FE320F4